MPAGARAFSAVTLDLPDQEEDQTPMIVENSRGNYSLNRASVETHIGKQYIPQTPQKLPEPQEASKESQPEPAKEPKSAVPNHSPANVGKAAVKGSEAGEQEPP